MQVRFPAWPKSRWIPPGLGGQSLPPARDKGQPLSPACTRLFALLPINGAALSSGQGPEAAQSPLARQGHRSREGEGVPQITPADKWVSNGVLSLAPPWPSLSPRGWGNVAPALPSLTPIGLQLSLYPRHWPCLGASPLLRGVTPAMPVPSRPWAAQGACWQDHPRGKRTLCP